MFAVCPLDGTRQSLTNCHSADGKKEKIIKKKYKRRMEKDKKHCREPHRGHTANNSLCRVSRHCHTTNRAFAVCRIAGTWQSSGCKHLAAAGHTHPPTRTHAHQHTLPQPLLSAAAAPPPPGELFPRAAGPPAAAPVRPARARPCGAAPPAPPLTRLHGEAACVRPAGVRPRTSHPLASLPRQGCPAPTAAALGATAGPAPHGRHAPAGVPPRAAAPPPARQPAHPGSLKEKEGRGRRRRR